MKRLNHKLTTLLLGAMLFVTTGYLQSQVTIGSGIPPTRAALLDLKTQQADAANVTSLQGGLLLPRVELASLSTLEPFIPLTDEEWTDATKKATLTKSLIGLMIYNLSTTNGFTTGAYIWDGDKWTKPENTGGGGIIYTGTVPIAISGTNAISLNDDGVTTEKLANGAVTAVKLNQMAATNEQVLKWNGTAWAPAADANTNTTYTGTVPIAISGTNAISLNDGGVTTDKLATGAVTAVKLNQMAATNGQVLKWNGTAWAPAADANTNTTYTGTTPITVSGTTVSLDNLGVGSGKLATDAVITEKILNGAVTGAKINQMAATNGQVLKWNGSAWAPAVDANTNTTYTGTTPITVSGTAVSLDNLGVNTAKLAPNAVTLAKLADNSVNSDKIVDGSIVTADMASNAATLAKFDNTGTDGYILQAKGPGNNAQWVNPASAGLGGGSVYASGYLGISTYLEVPAGYWVRFFATTSVTSNNTTARIQGTSTDWYIERLYGDDNTTSGSGKQQGALIYTPVAVSFQTTHPSRYVIYK